MVSVWHKARHPCRKGVVKKNGKGAIRKVHVSIASHSAIHALASCRLHTTDLNTLEKQMNKLMSSLIAATIVGAFSLSAIAADAPAAPAAATAAEKPAAAPKKAHSTKKHTTKTTTKTEEKKPDAAAMQAAPAKK
jgi:hypothetical protein